MLQITAATLALCIAYSHGWSFNNARSDDTRSLLSSAFTFTVSSRRAFLSTATIGSIPISSPWHPPEAAFAAMEATSTSSTAAMDGTGAVVAAEALVSVTGDANRLFNEGRALETQGNIAAAQRLYAKVTQIAPRFIYGWSNLGNTQTAFGELDAAEVSYNTAVDLCYENLATTEAGFGLKRCSDLYVLLLNRGALRLNNGRPKDGLDDLRQSEVLRGRPDAIVLQNLARALEVNGYYAQADRDYTTAISMTSNEVSPFWLRAALVKFQIGDVQGGYDLFKRVEKRFPEAPEVRAAYAVFLTVAKGDADAGRQKFLEIPDRQRLKYVDAKYLTQTISWPPAMLEQLKKITTAVGDDRRTL